jgi:hypothetical protein
MLNLVKLWLQVHARQIATVAVWGAVMLVAHRWPAHTADVELVASALALAIGIQLPPFKFSAQSLTKLVGSALIVAVFVLTPLVALVGLIAACSPRVTAKDAYYVEKEGCVQSYSARADQETCLRGVESRWNEAGAPPASTEGGIQ